MNTFVAAAVAPRIPQDSRHTSRQFQRCWGRMLSSASTVPCRIYPAIAGRINPVREQLFHHTTYLQILGFAVADKWIGRLLTYAYHILPLIDDDIVSHMPCNRA